VIFRVFLPKHMKIAFVVPWFGPTCVGGAEQEARNTALNLQKAGLEIEVLTTCVKDSHANWNQDFYPAGLVQEDGLAVRRFPVRSGRHEDLNRVLQNIRLDKTLTEAEEKIFINENVRSLALNDFIVTNRDKYDFFVYIPYLYGTTLDGRDLVPEKSLLIPCLHNENFARLKVFREVFKKFRYLVFHAEAEKKLAEELFQVAPERCGVLFEGVNTAIKFEKDAFRKKFNFSAPYLLFVGRKDEGKNLPLLINYFENFKKNHPAVPLKLVLIGRGETAVSASFAKEILDLGYVSEEDKYNAYADALATVQPSLNESFSLVLMESWLAETPVLVNAFCAVTKEHCDRSNAGLYFSNFMEFSEAVKWLLKNEDKRRQMAALGRQYVLSNFTWDKIVKKYLEMLKELKAGQ
jgi:glycosyltransferase involved in cell wall biosynthesis